MKVSTEIDNNFGHEKITQLVDNIPLNRFFSFLMSNNKVRSPLTDMINIFMKLHGIVFRIN
jgi:hypothetical protein